MELTRDELRRYEEDGLLFFPSVFNDAEIARLRAATAEVAAIDHPSRVLEKDGRTVRALHGCHLTNEVMARLTRLPRLLRPAEQIIGGPAYVYQFKVNYKAAFGGDVWQWHQDYIFWRKGDGMAEPRCVNLMVYLDEVTEFNGPLMCIPRSHQYGMIAVEPARGRGDWRDNVSADLKYSLDQDTIARLVEQGGIVAPKGPAGSVLLFHPNLAHGSAPNLSPWDRTMMIVTYNSVANVPVPPGEPRPDFLVSRDTRPLTVADEALAE
jgi:ectoine hydroxylase